MNKFYFSVLLAIACAQLINAQNDAQKQESKNDTMHTINQSQQNTQITTETHQVQPNEQAITTTSTHKTTNINDTNNINEQTNIEKENNTNEKNQTNIHTDINKEKSINENSSTNNQKNDEQKEITTNQKDTQVNIISIEDFLELYNQNINKINLNENVEDFILIDVRETGEYYEDHIPGSINLPLTTLEDSYIPESHKKMIIHCKSGTRSAIACKIIQEKYPQKKDIYSLDGGISKWKAANNYVDSRDGISSLTLQKQSTLLAAGIITITSLIATSASSIAIIPVCLGCGLIYANITNKCTLAELLKKAPWNADKN